MVKKRRHFPKDFKLEAVQLARESERSVAEVARDLGLAPSLLHKWVRQLEVKDPATAFPGSGKMEEADEEVRRLRRELERVTQERDFLKKAAASSTGHRNTRYFPMALEGVAHGTDRTSWFNGDAEGGVVAPVETRGVVE